MTKDGDGEMPPAWGCLLGVLGLIAVAVIIVIAVVIKSGLSEWQPP